MSRISRRTVLAGIGVAGVAGSGGIALFMTAGGRTEAMRAILHRLVGPFTMADAEFARFAQDFEKAYRAMGALEADMLRLFETAGPVRDLTRLRPSVSARLESFDRKLLTEFALATGLTGTPPAAPLEYRGLFAANPCTNPFAHLA